MSDHVKRLPAGVARTEMGSWPVAVARQWRDARPPVMFAPGAGAWGLAAATAVLWVMAWHDVTGLPSSTHWRDYGEVLLLGVLPLWFRFLPAPALFAAAALAVNSLVGLVGYDTSAGERARHVLELAVAAYAFAGGWHRLRGRRLQRRLFRAAVADADGGDSPRSPADASVPEAGRVAVADRGRWARWALLSGAVLCLTAAALLAYGLSRDLEAGGTSDPYNAYNEQGLALVCLAAGTPLLGRGVEVWWGLRRLVTRNGPALVVGVRVSAVGFHWLYPDAVTVKAPPLAACSRWATPRALGTRSLAGGAEASLRKAHRDVDSRREPYEAILYGEAYEGSEILLESAVYHADGNRLVPHYRAAGILPNRPPETGPWTPAEVSHRQTVRARQAEERVRREERGQREERAGKSGGCGGCGGSCGGCGG